MLQKLELLRATRTLKVTSTSGNIDAGGDGGGRIASMAAAVAASTSIGASGPVKGKVDELREVT